MLKKTKCNIFGHGGGVCVFLGGRWSCREVLPDEEGGHARKVCQA